MAHRTAKTSKTRKAFKPRPEAKVFKVFRRTKELITVRRQTSANLYTIASTCLMLVQNWVCIFVHLSNIISDFSPITPPPNSCCLMFEKQTLFYRACNLRKALKSEAKAKVFKAFQQSRTMFWYTIASTCLIAGANLSLYIYTPTKYYFRFLFTASPAPTSIPYLLENRNYMYRDFHCMHLLKKFQKSYKI